jgi:hypothetical protein
VRRVSGQHALKMLTHRINIISGLTLESQNESWVQFTTEWGGFVDRRLVTTEGIQFTDLRFWDAGRHRNTQHTAQQDSRSRSVCSSSSCLAINTRWQ